MKNFENRLTKIENAAVKTENVIVEYKDPTKESTDIDLLEAVRLFLKGSVRCISTKWKPEEEREYITSVQREIEDYIKKLTEKEKECHNCDVYKKYH